LQAKWVYILAHHSKKKKQWRLPKTEGSISKYTVPPVWPTYIGERRTPFSKEYGIKVGKRIWDFGQNIWDESKVLLGTPLGNTSGV
jgi:hypothetical protein